MKLSGHLRSSMQQRIINKLTVLAILVFGLSFVSVAVPANASAAAGTKCAAREFSIANENKKDTCVKYIQQMININNSAKLAVDGYYGPKTTAQVAAYQKKQTNLKADGVVGNDTWSTLCARQDKYKTVAKSAGCVMTTTKVTTNPVVAKPISLSKKRDANHGCDAYTYRQNAEGTCVKYIQQMFNTAGAGLETDGKYGPKTANIVKIWQEVFKIKGDQAGVMGSNTWDHVCFWNGTVPSNGKKPSTIASDKIVANWQKYARLAGCNI